MPRSSEIRSMFTRITGRYDLLNRVLSFGRDSSWRTELARSVCGQEARLGLDLCCGTGDVAITLRVPDCGAPLVVSADFSFSMCLAARDKLIGHHGPERGHQCLCADGLRLPFADSVFDFVTVAFGVRNFEDLDSGLAEIARVLRPGGRLGILEFAPPRGLLLKALYTPYLKVVPPLAGMLIARSRDAYRYLSDSVMSFLTPEQMEQALRGAGFSSPRSRGLSLGVTMLYTATRN